MKDIGIYRGLDGLRYNMSFDENSGEAKAFIIRPLPNSHVTVSWPVHKLIALSEKEARSGLIKAIDARIRQDVTGCQN